MRPTSEAISPLLGTLYDAAGNPALWQQFLQELANETGATSAALVMYDAEHKSYALSTHWRFDLEAVELYGQYYGALDIWGQRALSKRTTLVCVSEALSPFKELVSSQIYHDFLVPFGIEHGMFALVENTGSSLVSCSLFRDSSRGQFQPSELETLRSIAPHLKRAFTLHAQFCELKSRSSAVQSALDTLPTGVVFLGPAGEIVLMNRSASDLISQRDGLLAASTGLRAEAPSESDLLARTIRQATRGIDRVGGATLASRRGRPPLQILIAPVGDSTPFNLPAAQQIKAIAFVIDPCRQQRPTPDVLRAIFGLTPAESRVALLLSDCHAPRKIAEMIGVSENTVRSQMKSIFSKTGVRRQGELIRLLSNNSQLPARQGSPGF